MEIATIPMVTRLSPDRNLGEINWPLGIVSPADGCLPHIQKLLKSPTLKYGDKYLTPACEYPNLRDRSTLIKTTTDIQFQRKAVNKPPSIHFDEQYQDKLLETLTNRNPDFDPAQS